MHERGSVIPEHSNVGPGSGVATEQDSLTEESRLHGLRGPKH